MIFGISIKTEEAAVMEITTGTETTEDMEIMEGMVETTEVTETMVVGMVAAGIMTDLAMVIPVKEATMNVVEEDGAGKRFL